MFIKFTVYLLAVALVLMIIIIIRQRSKNTSNQNLGKKLKPERNWVEHLDNLTLPQLKQKIIDLEERRSAISYGFITMNAVEQENVKNQVSDINKKIEKVKNASEERSLGRT